MHFFVSLAAGAIAIVMVGGVLARLRLASGEPALPLDGGPWWKNVLALWLLYSAAFAAQAVVGARLRGPLQVADIDWWFVVWFPPLAAAVTVVSQRYQQRNKGTNHGRAAEADSNDF